MNCITSAIALTNEEIEARFEAVGFGGLAIGYGDEDNIVVTSETIEDFKASREKWKEPGRLERDEATALVIKRAQAVGGQPREDIAILDFGDVRLVYRWQ